MPSSVNQESFLQLIRLEIGTSKDVIISKEVDWKKLKALADVQGLTAVVLDGLNSVGDDQTVSMPVQLKLEWIGEVLQNYEGRYSAYKKAIAELARFYNQHGYKMMVIKGYGLSLNYPKPSHRPCGDIDIWLFGKQKEADAALNKELGVKIDNGHHHHSVFDWKGFSVENHYDFMNIHYGHRNKELEIIFKELGKDDSNYVEVCGESVYLPSPNLHALFLLRHCLQDFAAAVLTLRQVLDWGLFVEKNTSRVDWNWLKGIVDEFKMTDFFNSLNAICVGDLGFGVKIFPNVQFDPFLKEKVLNDILTPEYKRQSPRGFVKGMVYKYRRWQGNAWKQEMCYHDSRWSAFWIGLWNHLLKPKTL